MHSRYRQRHRKRRQDFLLNGLIAIVVILILVVGARILWGTSAQEAGSSKTNASQADKNALEVQASPAGENVPADGEETVDDDLVDDNGSDRQTAADSEKTDVYNGYRFKGGGPDGPWEPIGTKQTGEHVSTYEEGTIDREEKDLAVAYGAGLLDELRNDQLIVWRIENIGGSSERAVGKVTTKSDQNKLYVVSIEWVDEKGWKPTNVEIKNRGSE